MWLFSYVVTLDVLKVHGNPIDTFFSGKATLYFSSFHLSKPTNILNEILKSFLTKKHSDLFADNSELEMKHIALETFDLSDITNETSPRPTHSYHVLLNMFPI